MAVLMAIWLGFRRSVSSLTSCTTPFTAMSRQSLAQQRSPASPQAAKKRENENVKPEELERQTKQQPTAKSPNHKAQTCDVTPEELDRQTKQQPTAKSSNNVASKRVTSDRRRS